MSMELKKKIKIAGIGEILWDVFPDCKRLGGATSNFAYYVSRLGQNGIIASRIGNDPLGKEVIHSLNRLGINQDYIQIDTEHPTGTVEVKLDKNGNPDYIIFENVAWDFLELNSSLAKLAKEVDAACFGTLSQRSPKSKETINNFLNMMGSNTLKILDINLRQSYYTEEVIINSLKIASILKLNIDEFAALIKLLGYEGDNKISLSRRLINEYDLELVCCTRGKNGSLLVGKNDYFEHPGYEIKIADTVGAGDAFTAAMVVGYLNSGNLEEISNKANKMGSLVASFTGPILELSDSELQNCLRD